MIKHTIDTGTLPDGWSLPEVATLAGYVKGEGYAYAQDANIVVLSNMSAQDVADAVAAYVPRVLLLQRFIQYDIEDVSSARWDDVADLVPTEELHYIEYEEYDPATDAAGSFRVIRQYGARDDFDAGGDAWLLSATPPVVVCTTKAYSGSRDGPGLRTMDHEAFYSDGTSITWSSMPRSYPATVQMRKGRKRRQEHIDRLVVSLRASIEAGNQGNPKAGADALSALSDGIERFVEGAETDLLLATLDAAGMSAFVPAVSAALVAWS